MSTLLEAGAWPEWVYPETLILLGLFRGSFRLIENKEILP